tara:strand:- start:219 stop:1298 length:1080 start_codon:yes stop_codon:yes gene_type:complete
VYSESGQVNLLAAVALALLARLGGGGLGLRELGRLRLRLRLRLTLRLTLRGTARLELRLALGKRCLDSVHQLRLRLRHLKGGEGGRGGRGGRGGSLDLGLALGLALDLAETLGVGLLVGLLGLLLERLLCLVSERLRLLGVEDGNVHGVRVLRHASSADGAVVAPLGLREVAEVAVDQLLRKLVRRDTERGHLLPRLPKELGGVLVRVLGRGSRPCGLPAGHSRIVVQLEAKPPIHPQDLGRRVELGGVVPAVVPHGGRLLSQPTGRRRLLRCSSSGAVRHEVVEVRVGDARLPTDLIVGLVDVRESRLDRVNRVLAEASVRLHSHKEVGPVLVVRHHLWRGLDVLDVYAKVVRKLDLP